MQEARRAPQCQGYANDMTGTSYHIPSVTVKHTVQFQTTTVSPRVLRLRDTNDKYSLVVMFYSLHTRNLSRFNFNTTLDTVDCATINRFYWLVIGIGFSSDSHSLEICINKCSIGL